MFYFLKGMILPNDPGIANSWWSSWLSLLVVGLYTSTIVINYSPKIHPKSDVEHMSKISALRWRQEDNKFKSNPSYTASLRLLTPNHTYNPYFFKTGFNCICYVEQIGLNLREWLHLPNTGITIFSKNLKRWFSDQECILL